MRFGDLTHNVPFQRFAAYEAAHVAAELVPGGSKGAGGERRFSLSSETNSLTSKFL